MKPGCKKKFELVMAAVLELRRNNDDMSAPQMLDEMRRQGYDPLPTSSTVCQWCRDAGIPIVTYNRRSQFSDEMKRRVIEMRRSGMTDGEVYQALSREIDSPPSESWIRIQFKQHIDGNANRPKPRKVDPWKDVNALLLTGAFDGYEEAFRILDRAGVHHQVATAAIMAHYCGGNIGDGRKGCILDAEEPDDEIVRRIAA